MLIKLCQIQIFIHRLERNFLLCEDKIDTRLTLSLPEHVHTIEIEG